MIKFNNTIIENAIMDALDKMERGIEVDRNELIDLILKYGDRDFGIKNKDTGKSYAREKLQNSVYIHIVNENNKCYVGQTSVNPKDRWGYNGDRYYKGQVFYKAIKKYGWDNFSHIVLCYGLNEEEANNMEITLISLFETTNREFGYNIANGGNSVGKHSEETRKKMSDAKKGENNAMYGKKRSGGINPNAKKVHCGGKIFSTVKECAKFYNVPPSTMYSWLRRKKITNSNSEFIEKDLRFATQEDIDTYPLYIEETINKISNVKKREINPNAKAVHCDGMIFQTGKQCAEYCKVKYSTMNSWLLGRNKIPSEFIEKGLRYVTKEDIEKYPLYIEEEQNQ